MALRPWGPWLGVGISFRALWFSYFLQAMWFQGFLSMESSKLPDCWLRAGTMAQCQSWCLLSKRTRRWSMRNTCSVSLPLGIFPLTTWIIVNKMALLQLHCLPLYSDGGERNAACFMIHEVASLWTLNHHKLLATKQTNSVQHAFPQHARNTKLTGDLQLILLYVSSKFNEDLQVLSYTLPPEKCFLGKWQI